MGPSPPARRLTTLSPSSKRPPASAAATPPRAAMAGSSSAGETSSSSTGGIARAAAGGIMSCSVRMAPSGATSEELCTTEYTVMHVQEADLPDTRNREVIRYSQLGEILKPLQMQYY